MDLSNIKLTLMELCSKMQRNAYEIAKMEVRPPVSSQNMYPLVINSWLRACLEFWHILLNLHAAREQEAVGLTLA